MKKVIIGLSALVFAVFVVVLFVNAKNDPKDLKKTASTEISKDCGRCPAATTSCAKMAETKSCCEAKACDKSKCKEMGCDAAKCQVDCQTKCEAKNGMNNCSVTKCEMKKCNTVACKSASEK